MMQEDSASVTNDFKHQARDHAEEKSPRFVANAKVDLWYDQGTVRRSEEGVPFEVILGGRHGDLELKLKKVELGTILILSKLYIDGKINKYQTSH